MGFKNISLKVFINKKNGQPIMYLPKKTLNSIPTSIVAKIPSNLFKLKPKKVKGNGF